MYFLGYDIFNISLVAKIGISLFILLLVIWFIMFLLSKLKIHKRPQTKKKNE